ncbi:MAG: hypothetical protein IJ343_12755 [Clostridia bacterium]|nr:hypothetical protein [Clostridia bacterium]
MRVSFFSDGLHFDYDGKLFCVLYRYTAPDGRTFLTYAQYIGEETELLYALMTIDGEYADLEPLTDERDWALCDALYEKVMEAIGNDPDGTGDRVIDETVAAFVPPENLELTEERRKVVRALMLREARTPEEWLLEMIFGSDSKLRADDEDDAPAD